ncbi:hypothetical protein JRI60_32670 [Archangium violaceum]|uniref:hypothetical protein n=1 Tax=Archangium violaceum TaxID=83451 RepID=UPI00194EE192|nr:hypothetical protein [Archangium violaceum]QRN93894.1 hypothetical protein JRI60_32670 [Archangium violaceum]
MKKSLSLCAVTMTLGLATQASAAWAPSSYRCAFDQITNQDQARGRQQWAKKWADADPYNISANKDQRFWAAMFNQDALDSLNNYQTWLYPVYVDPNQGYDPVMGPGAAGSDTAGLTGDQIFNLDYTIKPVQVLMDGVCEPGCYTPDQKVLFQSGEVPIEKAQQAGADDLVTLSSESTLDAVQLVNNTVERYTVDRDPVRQDVLDFRMASGGKLSVTLEHPLVTGEGSLRKAKEFTVGEHLVRQDGSLDQIVTIEKRSWYGRVYNLRPVSKDLTSNILVAEGYLNGSARFQSEYVEELNRLILRKNVPDDVIPQN